MSVWKSIGLAAVLAFGAAGAKADEVIVFAAASLKPALDPVAAAFEAKTGHQVRVSYGGSNQLAKQILQGAPADLFISASEPWMDEVEKGNMIVAGTRRDLLGNSLVVIGAAGQPALDLTDAAAVLARLGEGRLAMGMVDAVPAGQYGKAAFEHLGLWSQLADRVVETDNVRAVLTLVDRGEAPMGVVYSSDAQSMPALSRLADFPADSHPPILYPVALLTGAQDAGDRAFLEALSQPEAREVFKGHGFDLVE